jgi:hypothetical protein
MWHQVASGEQLMDIVPELAFAVVNLEGAARHVPIQVPNPSSRTVTQRDLPR